MKIKLIARKPAADVTCWREPAADPEGRSVRCCAPVVSIAQTIIHHSPAGFEWGYGGSGPADLALVILHHCLPVGCDGAPAVKLFKGRCSQIAWTLHQDFKRAFIAGMADEGGVIPGAEIDAWIDSRLVELMQPEGSTMAEGFPPRETM